MHYGIAIWLPQAQTYAVLDHNLNTEELAREAALRWYEGIQTEVFDHPRPHKQNAIFCRACQRWKPLA